MKAEIINMNGEVVGKIEATDGNFTWTYSGEDMTVASNLKRAENYTIHGYDGDYEIGDGETAREELVDAPAEEKCAYAKRLLRQIGSVLMVRDQYDG